MIYAATIEICQLINLVNKMNWLCQYLCTNSPIVSRRWASQVVVSPVKPFVTVIKI